MIQMLGSHDVKFDKVKVIGGCPGNANQDGMDWLGGGDAVIRDSFFRASDDIFALYDNWLGYDTQSQTTAGETVHNITIENSVLSTSISNVVRVSWPQKIIDSGHSTGTTCLKAGKHNVRLAVTHLTAPDAFSVRWRRPASPARLP